MDALFGLDSVAGWGGDGEADGTPSGSGFGEPHSGAADSLGHEY